jgi:tetratricopeptide (TPR) repeat protein
MMFISARSKLLSLLIAGLLLIVATAQAQAADVVIVMPFENRSQRAEYNWIRESFALSLAGVLDVPGMTVIGADERNAAFEKLRLTANDVLTRAAMIRVTEAAQANLAVVGEFDIGGEKEGTTVAITARLIETQSGRLVGNKVFNFSGPLTDLQRMQGQLAWHVLYERNPALPYTKDQLISRATSVPPRAYESFVKGIQTPDAQLRASFLRRAMQEYEVGGGAGHYAQAVYELGLLLYRQAEFAEAVKQLKTLVKGDPHFDTSRFYLGLAAYKAGDRNEAETAFSEASQKLEVWNNLGATLLAKGETAKALPWLQRAVANNPNDPLYQFNYGYALWRDNKYDEAVQHLRQAAKLNPRDGEAQFILAKALTAAGQNNEAAQVDNEAKRHLPTYAKWAVAPDKIPVLVRLKEELSRGGAAKSASASATASVPTAQQVTERQRMENARQLLAANNAERDAEALNELQQVLAANTGNAEAHHLRGVALQRRNQPEGAIGAFQAALSWNPKLVEAHVALARLYLTRGERGLALAHCKQALELDPQNRDAIALKQQIEIGR